MKWTFYDLLFETIIHVFETKFNVRSFVLGYFCLKNKYVDKRVIIKILHYETKTFNSICLSHRVFF